MKNFNSLATITLLFFVAVAMVFGSDYPITNRADSIHPRQSELALTTLSDQGRKGHRTLRVEDSQHIDPRLWVLVQNADGSRQETHCVKSVEAGRVKLAEDLHHTFAAGSRVIQGSVARERGVVAKLVKRAGSGDSRLDLDRAGEVDALEQVILQSQDGRTREAHCVKWISDFQVELVNDLENSFEANAGILQGGLIDGVADKEENVCCCPGKNAGR